MSPNALQTFHTHDQNPYPGDIRYHQNSRGYSLPSPTLTLATSGLALTGTLRHRCVGAYDWCCVTEGLQIRALSIANVILIIVYVVQSPSVSNKLKGT